MQDKVVQLLETRILPELEKGRPNWDRPHTLAVVHWLREILAHSPELDLDASVLLIAGYAHDWGYADLFDKGRPIDREAELRSKPLHMERGAQKLDALLTDPLFDFLTSEQKQRCVHLVRVHDDLEQLSDPDEWVLMEADTLAALDVDRVEPTYDFESNDKYLKETREKRVDRFVTDYGRTEVERLYAKREDYYRRMCQVVFLGTGNAFSAGLRSTSSVLIRTHGSNLLIETGPALMEQLARARIQAKQIKHLFVSHAHGDHILGFPMLILKRRQYRVSTPLNVYGGMNTLSTLAMLCRIAYPTHSADRLNVRWHELSEREDDEVQLEDGFTLRTTVVPHPEGVPTLAARWEWAGGPSVSFVTDTIPCEASVRLASGSDLLIHEATYSDNLEPDNKACEQYHSTARRVGDLARGARCRRLALIHLGIDTDEEPKTLEAEARAGTDLEVIVPQDGHIERLFRNP